MSQDAAAQNVTGRATRAFGWSFGNTIVSRFGTLAISVVIARVIGPEQFGVFAIATVTLLAVLSFNELGVSLAVVRWRDDPATITPTVNTLAVAASAVLAGGMVLAAPAVASVLGEPSAAPVIQVMAGGALLNGIAATPAAVLQRRFMQRQLAIANQVNTWLGAGVSLVLVLCGWDAMSLAVGRIVAGLVFVVMLLRASPLPYRFGWDRSVVSRLVRFGLPLAASSIIVFLAGYADQIVVGWALGAQVLGYYVLAFNLAGWPVAIFSQPLRAVAPAAFAALQDDRGRMTRGFFRVLAVLSAVAVPACLAVSGAGTDVVRLVYGPAWAAAGPVLVWLAGLAMLRIWFELAYDFVVVTGRTGRVLVIQAATFAVSCPLMLAVVGPGGIVGVAAVQVLVGAALTAPMYLGALRSAGVRLLPLVRVVAVPLLVGAVVWGGTWAMGLAEVHLVLAVAVEGGVGLLGCVALLTLRRGEVRSLLSAARGRSGAEVGTSGAPADPPVSGASGAVPGDKAWGSAS